MATRTLTSILAVDDDDRFRETLADAMSLGDADVQSVTSCADALNYHLDRRA